MPRLGKIAFYYHELRDDLGELLNEEKLRPYMTQQEKSLTTDLIHSPLDFTPVFANLLKFGRHHQVSPKFAMSHIGKMIKESKQSGGGYPHLKDDAEVLRVMSEFGTIAKNFEEQLRSAPN